jgi:hypothetical protein
MKPYLDNPYPHFVDCNEAFHALLDLFEEDLDIQREITIDHIKSFLGKNDSCYADSELLHLINKVKEAQSLSDIREALDSENNDAYKCDYKLYPPKFIMHDLEVLQDVEFIHWTPFTDKIMSEGFRGRATPHKQTLTRLIPDFSILGNGYIFAYTADLAMDKTVVGGTHGSIASYIKGVATHALQFELESDKGDVQLIIPVKCIEEGFKVETPPMPDWMSEFF